MTPEQEALLREADDIVLGAVMRPQWRSLICNLARDLRIALADAERYRAILNDMAAWGSGPQVNGGFDCPSHAQQARDALSADDAARAGKD